jgi:hypothetical protein
MFLKERVDKQELTSGVGPAAGDSGRPAGFSGRAGGSGRRYSTDWGGEEGEGRRCCGKITRPSELFRLNYGLRNQGNSSSETTVNRTSEQRTHGDRRLLTALEGGDAEAPEECTAGALEGGAVAPGPGRPPARCGRGSTLGQGDARWAFLQFRPSIWTALGHSSDVRKDAKVHLVLAP